MLQLVLKTLKSESQDNLPVVMVKKHVNKNWAFSTSAFPWKFDEFRRHSTNYSEQNLVVDIG